MKEGHVKANGMTFHYLEEGEGPLVLLLHGFPDTAQTWDSVMAAIANTGYRAVAPWTRGYPPTEIPTDAYFDSATLATDARALITELNNGDPAYVVGHDWGGATTWYLIAAYPEIVKRAVILGIPHPFVVAQAFLSPEAIHSVFHFWFFQLQGLPEAAIRANDFAFVDYLWSIWSPGHSDPKQIANVKKAFAEPGAVEAALGYYRAMLDPAKQDPALADVRNAIAKPIEVPTLSLIGARELIRASAGESQRAFMAADFKFEAVADTSHFMHRERPDEVARLVLDWLKAS